MQQIFFSRWRTSKYVQLLNMWYRIFKKCSICKSKCFNFKIAQFKKQLKSKRYDCTLHSLHLSSALQKSFTLMFTISALKLGLCVLMENTLFAIHFQREPIKLRPALLSDHHACISSHQCHTVLSFCTNCRVSGHFPIHVKKQKNKNKYVCMCIHVISHLKYKTVLFLSFYFYRLMHNLICALKSLGRKAEQA